MFFYTFLPKILNMSLTASVAVVFVMLLRQALKKAPKVISYALWGVVLFRLLCPVSVKSDLSLYRFFDTPTVSTSGRTSTVEYIPSNLVHTEFPEVTFPVSGIGEAVTEHLPSGEEQLAADPLEAPMSIATYVWLGGILVMAAYGTVTCLRLRRRLATASPLRGNIYLADEIRSPFVMGLIRPRIYLPSAMEERERSYIIFHEQHHIRRLDHIVKALAFAALCIHWFNPLVWLAFILSGRDMEMSCDEAVVRKLGPEIRADYSASLLSLATGRRIIAGMPLSFGEGSTKGRIRNLAGWKKPAFRAVFAAALIGIILAVCLLTNPGTTSEFAMSGDCVSDLEVDGILERIRKAKGLRDGDIYVNSDSFNLTVDAEFGWVDSQALRYFFYQNGAAYSAQLRIFPENQQFLITESSEWIEPEREFLLERYLQAVRDLPQEEIRQVAPADRYTICLMEEGAPEDYSRVITYTPDGAGEISEWQIHLELQPLHESGGAYNGTGGEEIHLFYGAVEEKDDSRQMTELIPGTVYVPWQCLYMTPFSSYMTLSGDNGCRYVVGEDYFAITSHADSSLAHTADSDPGTGEGTAAPDPGPAGAGSREVIEVPKWEWQAFPYTDEEWADLFQPGSLWDLENIGQDCEEILYQPLTEKRFLLRVDGDLWLAELYSDRQMGEHLWSIYSLVPESAMGTAQWEYAPVLSAGTPFFRFGFDMACEEISAVCTQGALADPDTVGTVSENVTVRGEDALYWSPLDEEGPPVSYGEISFSVQKNGVMLCAGTLYIQAGTGSDGRTVYTASLVGTGLHLSSDQENGGAVISLAAGIPSGQEDRQ